MNAACFFCDHDQCDICSVGRAYDPEQCQGDSFVEALLDWCEGGDPVD